MGLRHLKLSDNVRTKEFFYRGNRTGVLLIHGFTGTPSEMRYLGDYLGDQGFTVKGILLKGHGTSFEDMSQSNHRDWIRSAVEGYQSLKKECDEVFVVGFSMGGILALYLARNFDIQGVACLATPILIGNKRAYARHVQKLILSFVSKERVKGKDPSIIGYTRAPAKCILSLFNIISYIKQQLPYIYKPILIMQSYGDGTVNPRSANIIYRRIGSEDKSIIYLHESDHVITCDCEKERVFKEVESFIRSKSGMDDASRKIEQKMEVD